jgi:hypothetical protein
MARLDAENAGRTLAELAITRFSPTSVTVLAGPGGNAGELYLADISVPPLVYQRMGIPVPELFRQSSLLVQQ